MVCVVCRLGCLRLECQSHRAIGIDILTMEACNHNIRTFTKSRFDRVGWFAELELYEEQARVKLGIEISLD